MWLPSGSNKTELCKTRMKRIKHNSEKSCIFIYFLLRYWENVQQFQLQRLKNDRPSSSHFASNKIYCDENLTARESEKSKETQKFGQFIKNSIDIVSVVSLTNAFATRTVNRNLLQLISIRNDCDGSNTFPTPVPRHGVYETLIKNVFARRRNSRYIRTHVTRKVSGENRGE